MRRWSAIKFVLPMRSMNNLASSGIIRTNQLIVILRLYPHWRLEVSSYPDPFCLSPAGLVKTDAMPSNPTKLDFCLCSDCVKRTWTDHLGKEHLGILQRPKTIAYHRHRDKLRHLRSKRTSESTKQVLQRELEEEAQQALESSLFLSTISDYSTNPGEIVPERDQHHKLDSLHVESKTRNLVQVSRVALGLFLYAHQYPWICTYLT